jgi:phage FluMu gp28-like protein
MRYIRQCQRFADLFDYARSIINHGEDFLKVHRLDDKGHPTPFTDEVKVSFIKFDNGSVIRAFSSHPQAMAVYGGDVGLDEFAKHPDARRLWETAQGRVSFGHDIAVWSAHDGEDTLFLQMAQEARAGHGPWNLYYRLTMPDALELGLIDVINRRNGSKLTPEQFLANCRARARLDSVYEQSYLCNPVPTTASIVDWSAIERCRADYQIPRLHLEHAQIVAQFGEFNATHENQRRQDIAAFIRNTFLSLFQKKATYYLGFDVAASGQGDLAAIYIDQQEEDSGLWLRALFTCRTEDWHFLKSVLFTFLRDLRYLRAMGDESGLGRQICWEAAKAFPGNFHSVNFSSKKSDIGFALMNQLATVQKRFPREHQDIAGDYFALRKIHVANRWAFTEGRNSLNPPSHCDIAWAGALATHAFTQQEEHGGIGAAILLEDGTAKIFA